MRRPVHRGSARDESTVVVLRSSVIATLIVLFLAYLIGITPSPSPERPLPPPVEEERPAEETVKPTEDTDDVRPTVLALEGKTIVIDAGHGGADPGAIGVSGLTRESYNTLFVAQDVQQLLERAGARVVMTRNEDRFVSLDSRVSIANDVGADIFISIHNDSNPNASIRGVTTYYYTAQSQRLAEVMQDALAGGLGARSVGAWQRPFLVVRGPWMPAVLVELGFLTNRIDEQLLADPLYRYRAAEAIYKGVVTYFDGA